jgi:pSer/pThr/pTyr-binding forkhead associated (FHA) protein
MDVLLLALRILLALLLYSFLIALFAMLWRDLRQSATRREPARRAGRLVLLESPGEEGPDPGTSFALQPITSLGRSRRNTVPITDTYASAQHALLTWRHGQWWLEDRHSRNGTLLNDTPISGPTVISSGDIIGVGRVSFKLELE